MEIIAKNKGALAAAVLFLLAVLAYNIFSSSMPATEPVSATSLGADLIKISENISRATLSKEIFSSTGYRMLFDFSIPLVPEPTGRVNPFAPLGQD